MGTPIAGGEWEVSICLPSACNVFTCTPFTSRNKYDNEMLIVTYLTVLQNVPFKSGKISK